MNTIAKTAVTVAAAAVLGGGVVGINEYLADETQESVSEFVDDVKPIQVEIPKVNVITVKPISVETLSVALPEVNDRKVETHAVATETVETYAVNLSRVVPLIELDKLDVPEIEIVSVSNPGERIPRMIELQKLQQGLFRDQRNLMYDPSVGIDSASWTKWIKIYQSDEYKNYSPEYVELKTGLRIINEVKCPENTEQFQRMSENLKYYQSRGYNAVLVTFTTDEPLYRLADTIDYLKSCGLTVIIAYAGRENLNESLFRDPDTLAKFLRELGAKADALLLGWRRTSLHLFLPDRQWTNFLIKNARSKKSTLAVIGMAYFGETAEKQLGVTYDVPENCSAVLVVGCGYPKASRKTVLKKLFPEIVDHPHKIGLVVGERPYFDSLHDTGKTKKQNDQIKRRIELRLLQAGCDSTMTYRGDGSDGQYGRTDRTENLCLPYGK